MGDSCSSPTQPTPGDSEWPSRKGYESGVPGTGSQEELGDPLPGNRQMMAPSIRGQGWDVTTPDLC